MVCMMLCVGWVSYFGECVIGMLDGGVVVVLYWLWVLLLYVC